MLFAKLLTSLTILVTPSGDTTKYAKFEKEPVAQFRQAVEFTYPTVEFEHIPVMHEGHNPNPTISSEEALVYDLPPGLEKLILVFDEDPGEDVILDGFRVQIYAGGVLEDANSIRADFMETYTEVKTYRRWIQPTFRVRVGDFVTRNDAMIFCNEIRKDFPMAFVVPDQIKLPRVRRHEEIIDPEGLEKEKQKDEGSSDNR